MAKLNDKKCGWKEIPLRKRASNIPYSRKYWQSIKFGGLAVGEATVKFKSVKFKCDLRVRVRAYYM